MIVAHVYFIVVMLAMAGLSIDGSRVLLLRSNLQYTVGAAAAAGGRVLSRDDRTIQKAKDAANAVGSANIALLLSDASATIGNIRILSAINPDVDAATDDSAKYVKITGASAATSPWFPFTPVSLTATAAAVD